MLCLMLQGNEGDLYAALQDGDITSTQVSAERRSQEL